MKNRVRILLFTDISGTDWEILILISTLCFNIDHISRKSFSLHFNLLSLLNNIFGRIVKKILIYAVLIKKLKRVIYKKTKFFHYFKFNPRLSIN